MSSTDVKCCWWNLDKERKGEQSSIIIKLWEQISISHLSRGSCSSQKMMSHNQPHTTSTTTHQIPHNNTPHRTTHQAPPHSTHPVPCYTSSCSPMLSCSPSKILFHPNLVSAPLNRLWLRRREGVCCTESLVVSEESSFNAIAIVHWFLSAPTGGILFLNRPPHFLSHGCVCTCYNR